MRRSSPLSLVSVVTSLLGSLQMAISFASPGPISFTATRISSTRNWMRGQAIESSTMMENTPIGEVLLVPDILVCGNQEVIAFVFRGFE